MNIVRCNVCGKWIGTEAEIVVDAEETEVCPACGESGGLMDLDAGCNFNQEELRKLWILFGDVPINDADEIEESFLGFAPGTDRFEIWHWFDERYDGGVHLLLGLQ